ncbi:unnamed protein product [Wickerhamomyces anomalus]
MSSVLFLKNKTVPKDPYHESFQESGYNITFIPLLDHIHAELPVIVDYLKSSDFIEYTYALIITSQRAVEALDAALKLIDQHTRTRIFNKLAFTVGPATHKILSELGFKNIEGGIDAGNGTILSEIIINRLSKDQRVTFFTGETRRDIIPKRLTSEGFDLKEMVIYKTIAKEGIIDRFTESFEAQRANDSTKWIIFFSPQGTQEIVTYLKTFQHDSSFQSNCKIASIGPTTETYLIENGIKPHLVSSKPEAKTLLKDIQNYNTIYR